ncbi:MAG TPA: S8 family serine peptidase [Flavisolibacter sp.]|nr:S8 family serine peptidase [Flavisolibacter sp.]
MKKPVLLILTAIFSLWIRAQEKETVLHKLSPSFQQALSEKLTDSVDILCTVKTSDELSRTKHNGRIIGLHPSSNTISIRIPTNKLKAFIENNNVEFADLLRKPKEELTTGAFDLSLNKLLLAHDQFPNINGNGIDISIKEQQLDSLDIDWKGRYFNSGVGAPTQTSHASIMATILAGGANSSLYAIGAAPAANITSSSFASLLPDADEVYKQYNISIQNHSYGTGIENYYGADARAYDISVNKNPSLLHVFSAGNSGNAASTSGTYAGIEGFANLTGSFKMAKNIITVGSTDSFNNVMPLSSKGPAYDGRIKPELVAYGEDGSSGAAALTSGTAALIQQAYKLMHHDSLPPAALVKAILLNAADDIGTKGPDYSSGYGSLNAYNALRTVSQNGYAQGSVTNAAQRSFQINIPPNTKLLKITLAWSDTAAEANAAKALVNDLDLKLTYQSGSTQWEPWVLNSAADKNALLQAATRRKDTLNVVEQISIDDPQPGVYNIEVTGSSIKTTSQDFAIAWQADSVNSFIWTYPSRSIVLTAGNVATIRWQSNSTEMGTIECITDGIAWKPIASVAASQQYYQWTVPDTLAAARLRFLLPSINQPFLTDSFIISKALDLKVGFNCTDSFQLSWNKLPVSQYQVYTLGSKYLEPLLFTSDTSVILHKANNPSLYYAVAPLVGNKPGFRSYTLNYTTQGVDCYLRTFYAYLIDNNHAYLSAELGSLYNVKAILFQQQSQTGFQTIHSILAPGSLVMNFTDSSLIQGANFYRLVIQLANGQTITSPVNIVYSLPGNPVLTYPNPARSMQPINMVTGEPGKYTVRVYDMNGRMIKEVWVENMIEPLPALQLKAGMYIIRIISEDNKIYHQKLIVY